MLRLMMCRLADVMFHRSNRTTFMKYITIVPNPSKLFHSTSEQMKWMDERGVFASFTFVVDTVGEKLNRESGMHKEAQMEVCVQLSSDVCVCVYDRKEQDSDSHWLALHSQKEEGAYSQSCVLWA